MFKTAYYDTIVWSIWFITIAIWCIIWLGLFVILSFLPQLFALKIWWNEWSIAEILDFKSHFTRKGSWVLFDTSKHKYLQ